MRMVFKERTIDGNNESKKKKQYDFQVEIHPGWSQKASAHS